MTFKLTYENMLYLALGLVSIFIIYKLYNNYHLDKNEIENGNMNEGFQSIINKFKNNNNKNNSILKTDKKRNKLGKGSKVSFDDLVTEAENMDPSKYTVDSIKNNFFTYLESFQKAKFQNVSGTTNEALEKFGFFKEKFFEIFK
jgi:hypothetical protein